MYNPGVSDQRGAMAMQGLGNIAQMNYQAKASAGQSIAQGISSAGSALGGGISEAGQVYAQNAAKTSVNQGKLAAYAETGVLSGEQLDELAKIKDPDKLSGALAVVEDTLNFQRKDQLLRNEYSLRRGMVDAEQGESMVGKTLTITDPVTGEKVGAYYGNNKQVIPIPITKPKTQGGFRKMDLGGGASVWVDANGKPVSGNAIQKPDAMTQTNVATARKAYADAEADATKFGRDKEKSESIWPWAQKTTYGAVADAAKAKLEALEGGSGGAAQPQAQGAGDGGDVTYTSPDAVRNAVRSGKLSREEANTILKQQFGFQ